MSSITFVTCLLDIYKNEEVMIKIDTRKSIEKRVQYFEELVSTGIQLMLYISSSMEPYIKPLLNKYSNIIYKIIELEETYIMKTVNEHKDQITMPINRCQLKDTLEFMVLMNCKVEFMNETIKMNPWNSTHFAWIDFGIFYIFKHQEYCKKWLKYLSSLKLNPSFLTFPGCYSNKMNPDNVKHTLDNIYWRFCGGFFIGDKNSIIDFYNLYEYHFPIFLSVYQRMIWEVNFWNWLECFTEWSPTLYYSHHDDGILKLSSDYYSENISKSITSKLRYDYPDIHLYNPSSASYIEYNGRKILNTRYVNYSLCDDGSYIINSPDRRTLDTMNYLSVLDENFIPVNYNKIKEDVELTNHLDRAKRHISKGFEDIRLYIMNDQLKFIATTIQYSPLGQNRMVIGHYNINENNLHSMSLIEPPNSDTWCEKNWIPISFNNIKDDCFIYSWNPFKVGKITEGKTTHPEFSYKLEIVLERTYDFPMLDKIRGSSCFISYDENHYIGVVHYSEEYTPRHYYHLLVQLNKETLQIEFISEPFYFQKIGIEFCIGFNMIGKEFCFWISQMDRDPLYITMPVNSFQWTKIQ